MEYKQTERETIEQQTTGLEKQQEAEHNFQLNEQNGRREKGGQREQERERERARDSEKKLDQKQNVRASERYREKSMGCERSLVAGILKSSPDKGAPHTICMLQVERSIAIAQNRQTRCDYCTLTKFFRKEKKRALCKYYRNELFSVVRKEIETSIGHMNT